MTTLEELHGYPDGRPRAVSDAEKYSRDFGGENWLDQRRKAQTYTDRDPTVLIVGGGQAGLSAAARLNHLGVDTLIVDRNHASVTTGGCATTRSPCTTRCTSTTCR